MAAYYRKIYPHMWSDAKVLALSRPQPNGQTLWLELLSGEQTGIIPGVFRIGEAAFAEQLRWPIGGFREAFQEVFSQGMVKADWINRLVWVPNALRWNFPESPNVITSWSEAWRHLPECDLKREIWHAFRGFFEGFAEAFQKAFREALADPSAKAIEKTIGIQVAGSRYQVSDNSNDPNAPRPSKLGDPLPILTNGNLQQTKKRKRGSRKDGTNPRATGSNPRAKRKQKREQERVAKLDRIKSLSEGGEPPNAEGLAEIAALKAKLRI